MTPTPALATVQALAITLLAILPGAAYTFAFERGRGAFGVTLADRVIRFLAASAVFHAVVAGTEYALYKHLIHTGALARAQIPWYTVQLIAALYVAVPIAEGATVARAGPGQHWWPTLGCADHRYFAGSTSLGLRVVPPAAGGVVRKIQVGYLGGRLLRPVNR